MREGGRQAGAGGRRRGCSGGGGQGEEEGLYSRQAPAGAAVKPVEFDFLDLIPLKDGEHACTWVQVWARVRVRAKVHAGGGAAAMHTRRSG